VNVALSRILSLLCLMTTVAVVWWGVASGEPVSVGSESSAVPTTQVAAALSLSAFEPLWQLTFQGPPPTVDAPAATPVSIRLLGTIVDGPRSAAILQDSAGVTRWCKLEKTIDGFKLVSVARDSAEFAGPGGPVVLQREGASTP
jgi:hypothetical protein